MPQTVKGDPGSEIVFSPHKSENTITEIRALIAANFPESLAFYLAMDIHEYRTLVKETQQTLISEDYVRRISSEIETGIQEQIGEERFFIQTNLYCRASRPVAPQETESIGWHRESYYGPNMEKSLNVWTPISGVCSENTLNYIPGSQDIPSSEIETRQIDDELTTKGSTGNTIGFLYAPKKIVSGVDFDKSLPMNVPDFHSSLFPGELIHGNSVNLSDQIRFSIDFRILPFHAYDKNLNKGFHFASGKPYFEEY